MSAQKRRMLIDGAIYIEVECGESHANSKSDRNWLAQYCT